MYTYTQTFFGVPLSQLYDYGVRENDSFKKLLEGLTELVELDSVLALDVNQYLLDYKANEEDSKIFVMFFDWIKANQERLNELGFEFSSDYHGGDEYPMIFGSYGGISLPDTGCMKLDTSEFLAVVEKEKEVQDLFKTIPQDLVKRFPPFGLAGFWANDHSS